jgi:hypothetical protein
VGAELPGSRTRAERWGALIGPCPHTRGPPRYAEGQSPACRAQSDRPAQRNNRLGLSPTSGRCRIDVRSFLATLFGDSPRGAQAARRSLTQAQPEMAGTMGISLKCGRTARPSDTGRSFIRGVAGNANRSAWVHPIPLAIGCRNLQIRAPVCSSGLGFLCGNAPPVQ